jgi:hypothetical protein
MENNKKGEQEGQQEGDDDGSGHHLIIGVPTSAHGSNLNPIAVQISVVFFVLFPFSSPNGPLVVVYKNLHDQLISFFNIFSFLVENVTFVFFTNTNPAAYGHPCPSHHRFSLSRPSLVFHSLNSWLGRTGGRESDNTFLSSAVHLFLFCCFQIPPFLFFDNFKSHID